MRRKLRMIGIWLLTATVAVAAFVLALNVTNSNLEDGTKTENIVIDLDQNPADDIVTTEEKEGFWQRADRTEQEKEGTK